MTTAYEVSQALQGHEGVGLDKEYILASALHNDLTSTVLPVVSGVGEKETWDEVHFENLSSDVQQFRKVAAEQVESRLLQLDTDTLLALKMNPSIDSSITGILENKSAMVELMDAEFNRRLRHRGTRIIAQQHGAVASSIIGQPSAGGVDEGAIVAPVQKRRKTLGELAKMHTSLGSKGNIGVATEVVTDSDSRLAEKISLEKEMFITLCQSALVETKYINEVTQEFNQLLFYCDHETQIPIHAAVFFADCASKKAASANVEQIFSGAGTLLADFHSGAMGADMLEAYMFIRGNWQFEFLRPSVEEIVTAYTLAHSKQDDAESSAGESEASGDESS